MSDMDMGTSSLCQCRHSWGSWDW